MRNRSLVFAVTLTAGVLGISVTVSAQNCLLKVGNNCPFVMPTSGYLYLQPMGGSAAASTIFGIGTAPGNFVPFYKGLPNNPEPNEELLVGYFTAGTIINFGMYTTFGTQAGWAFSSSNDWPSMVSFTDINDSLGMGGGIIQQTGQDTWLLHLDDALSYLYDDDDDDVLMQVRVAPAAS